MKKKVHKTPPHLFKMAKQKYSWSTKAQDVLALIILGTGVGLVAWGDEIIKVAGVVLIALFLVYYIGCICAEAMRH